MFLKNSWGRKPQLFRNLLPVHSLTPDELAGLSMDLPSRIVSGSGDGESEGKYTLRHGPFSEHDYSKLPDSNWTLLVDHVNRYVPQVAELLDNFRFLPNWRVDDVMISYAPIGGSVGAHVDNYDVFLLQTSGKKLWKTSYKHISVQKESLVPDSEVRILKGGFTSDEEWVLEPGDALYVPPRFPHHGISLTSDCITYSIGFRSPSLASLMMGWVTHVVENKGLREHVLSDNLSSLVEGIRDPGRLSPNAADLAYDTIISKLTSDAHSKTHFQKWFATFVSQSGLIEDDEDDDDKVDKFELNQLLNGILDSRKDAGRWLVRQREGSIFVYFENGDKCSMFIDGEEWPVPNFRLASFICELRSRPATEYAQLYRATSEVKNLLRRLLKAGVLYVDKQADSPVRIDGVIDDVCIREE